MWVRYFRTRGAAERGRRQFQICAAGVAIPPTDRFKSSRLGQQPKSWMMFYGDGLPPVLSSRSA
jgi:hypothetical protein